MKFGIIVSLSILLFISFNSFSQNEFVDRHNPYYQFVESSPVKCLYPEGIKNVVLEQTHQDVETNFVKNMDELGRLYEYHTEPEGKGEHVSYTCSYSDGNASTGTYTSYTSNGDIDFQIVHEINTDGNPLSQVKKNGKGKLLEEITWTYNDNGLLKSTLFVEGDKKQVVNEWFYTYDSDGNIAESVIKDSKGRVIHTWIYDCKEERRSMDVEKSKTYICSWESNDDEFYLVNEQRFDEKGVERHHIWRYAIEDSTILAYLVYSETNKLVYKAEYDHSYDKPLVIKQFKDGKVDNKGVFKYTEGLLTNYSEYDGSNELIEHHLYIYNDEGFMSRARIYDDKNDYVTSIHIKHKSKY